VDARQEHAGIDSARGGIKRLDRIMQLRLARSEQAPRLLFDVPSMFRAIAFIYLFIVSRSVREGVLAKDETRWKTKQSSLIVK
jgi:hypothetical protein